MSNAGTICNKCWRHLEGKRTAIACGICMEEKQIDVSEPNILKESE